MTYYTFTNGTAADAVQVNNNLNIIRGCGDGSDGAFSESSGDTALTQGTIYEYTSFDMTGTATISTTKTTGEPIVVLVQGDLNITSSGTCDFKGYGEDSPTKTSAGRWTNGGTGSNGSASIGGDSPNYIDLTQISPNIRLNSLYFICSGTKGGTGGDAGGTGGIGGSGGASLIFVVGGNLTVSNVTFDMSGDSGGPPSGNAAGGGGGAGGSIVLLAFGSVTDSGTYTVTAGSGDGTTYGGVSGGAGGASLYTDASGASVSAGGANGAVGFSLVKQVK